MSFDVFDCRYSFNDELVRNREEIAKFRAYAGKSFLDFFKHNGAFVHSPDGLIPSYDKTVLFTGSTISTFKKYILQDLEVDKGGFCMVQNCLRTQNTSILLDDNVMPKWSSLFESIGLLFLYSELVRVCELVWAYFVDVLRVPEDYLYINISEKDRNLMDAWISLGKADRLRIDCYSDEYYTHKYGENLVFGRNCNLAIKDNATGEFRDLGNVIIIYVNDKPKFIEAAFGIETIASRMFGLSSPILATMTIDIIGKFDLLHLKLSDSLAASIMILDCEVIPISNNRGRVLRRYLQGLGYICNKLNLSYLTIEEYCIRFIEVHKGLNANIPKAICAYLHVLSDMSRADSSSENINKHCAIAIKNIMRECI